MSATYPPAVSVDSLPHVQRKKIRRLESEISRMSAEIERLSRAAHRRHRRIYSRPRRQIRRRGRSDGLGWLLIGLAAVIMVFAAAMAL